MPSQLARRRGIAPVALCKLCGDFGFTGAAGDTAKDVYETGSACRCPFGVRFLELQANWKLPISPRIKKVKRCVTHFCICWKI